MPAPDFSLPSAHGEIISLADYKRSTHCAGTRPVLLLFFHETQCRLCRAEIEALGVQRNQLAGAGVPFIAILPENRTTIYTVLGTTTLGYPLLQDPEQAVARRYGLYRLFGRDG